MPRTSTPKNLTLCKNEPVHLFPWYDFPLFVLDFTFEP